MKFINTVYAIFFHVLWSCNMYVLLLRAKSKIRVTLLRITTTRFRTLF